jgi:hypothetical protein
MGRTLSIVSFNYSIILLISCVMDVWTLICVTLTSKKGGTASSRGTIGWTYGVHEWVVRIDGKPFGVFVGISQEDIDPVGDINDISCTLGCVGGYVYAFGGDGVDYMDVPNGGLPVGSLVSVRLDLGKRTLTFGLNGKWHDKPAFIDIAPNTWYPFVRIYNTKVTIVQDA